MQRKALCLLGMIINFLSFLAAQKDITIEPILSQNVFSQLKENGVISHTFNNEKDVRLTLTPDTPLAKEAVHAWSSENSDKPAFLAENLYLLKKATLIANSSSKENIDTSLSAVSRIIRSISKMQGMQYYSNGDKKWETLYHQSYLVDSLENKKRIDDKTEGSSNGMQLYCLQEDNSFGTCIYRLNYRETEQEVSVSFTNAESLKYGPIKAVKPNNLKISLVVIESGDYYLVYMLVQAKYISFPLLEGRLNRSFNARIDAIYKWFTFQF